MRFGVSPEKTKEMDGKTDVFTRKKPSTAS